MTHDELKRRCLRIMGLYPESTQTPLDCMRLLTQLSDSSRAIAAEMLARELAEFVEEHHGK